MRIILFLMALFYTFPVGADSLEDALIGALKAERQVLEQHKADMVFGDLYQNGTFQKDSGLDIQGAVRNGAELNRLDAEIRLNTVVEQKLRNRKLGQMLGKEDSKSPW